MERDDALMEEAGAGDVTADEAKQMLDLSDD